MGAKIAALAFVEQERLRKLHCDMILMTAIGATVLVEKEEAEDEATEWSQIYVCLDLK